MPQLSKVLAVLSLAFASLNPNTASAQQHQCGDRAEIARMLEQKYKETRANFGISNLGDLIEVFVSPSGTWTILVSTPEGATCIFTYGEDWRKLTNKKLSQA